MHSDELIAIEENDSVTYRTFRELRHYGLAKITKLTPRPITAEARLSFERSFGIGADLQRTYEAMLQNWTFPLDRLYTFGQEWAQSGVWQSEMIPRYEVTLAEGDDE